MLPGNRIFISSGYGTGSAMLKLTGGAPEELWTSKHMRNQLNPSLYVDGYLYGVDGDTSGKATLNCIDAKTGELKWKGSERSGQAASSPPWASSSSSPRSAN